MRYPPRLDANQQQLVKDLRKAGILVLSLASVGHGCPDLLCCVAGELYLLEVKDASKSPSRRKLTPQEEAFAARWPVHVVTTVQEAIAVVWRHELDGPEYPNHKEVTHV